MPPSDVTFPFTLFLGFPGDSSGKGSAWDAGDPCSIPGSGRSPGEGIGYPLQLSPSLPAFSLSQQQSLFQRVSSSHQVAKVLEFQLQHQSFQ